MFRSYILAHKYPSLARFTGFTTGLLLAIGFCLQNARLIPSIPGEYQPTVFLAGCLLATITWGTTKAALYSSLAIAAGVLFPMALQLTMGEAQLPTPTTLIRLLVGPAILIGVASAWRNIDHRWLWGILWAYILFAAVGLLSPETTTQTVTALGTRINGVGDSRYFPWSGFFYAEYSFAALAFITLYCWLSARSEAQSYRLAYSTITILLLLATRSATAIALVLIVFLSQIRWRWLLALPLILFAMNFISPRVAVLFTAAAQVLQGNWGAFIQIDSSSAWRFVSNLGAFHVMQANPLGTMDLTLHPYLQTPNATPAADQLIQWWLATFSRAEAQGLAFNYGLFGGWISFVTLIILYLVACQRAFTCLPRDAALALIMLGFYALFVQSALTSLTTWVTLGIMLGSTRSEDVCPDSSS